MVHAMHSCSVTSFELAHSAIASQIDWLDLNSRGDLLLFRDKRRKLHVYDVVAQTRSTLLTYCSFVTWVPGSDVAVAQSRNQLCVWYNIFAPDKVTTKAIKGDVEVCILAPHGYPIPYR